MITIKDKKDCCGCTACYNACPKKAIAMQADQEGFLYPVIDQKNVWIAEYVMQLVLLLIK